MLYRGLDGSNTILIYYFGNARYMRIIVLGGFLGSGKTTILMKIANTFLAKGRKVAVLVNDVGEIGVDGKTLAAEGYNDSKKYFPIPQTVLDATATMNDPAE